jgi:hypothetical protein
MARFRKSSATRTHHFEGSHRFEHWYRDNTVYFITARCRDKYNVFLTEQAKSVFWDRFTFYTGQHGYVPIVTSLLSNHYHSLGYLRVGEELGGMMRKLHGSVAKLVNDLLPERRLPFWREAGHQDYFDGCIRDELQCRRAFRYTYTQCRRHHLCTDPAHYPHTRVSVDLERAVQRALELGAFMEGVPYKRYQRPKER